MSGLNDVIALLRALHEADNRLQEAFRDLLQRYFNFLRSSPRSQYKTTRWLRMRFERDREKRIRRIAWTIRIRSQQPVGGGPKALTRRLREPFDLDWVYNIAKDWGRKETYTEFNHERVALNSMRSGVLLNRLRIRRSFENRWASRPTDLDLARAARLVSENAPALAARDTRPLAGLLVYEREFLAAEKALGFAVTEWRVAYERSLEVRFEPALRRNEDGTFRLYWGFPQRVGTPEGMRTYTEYIAGGPTDLFLRRLRIRAATRKEVGAFVKRIRALERRYRTLVGQVGCHRKRVHELLSRVARIGSPRGDGGPRPDTRSVPEAQVGTPPKEAM
jgi:hypothetical protein